MVAEQDAIKFHDEALVNLRMAQIIIYALYVVGALSLFIACVWTLLVVCRLIRQVRIPAFGFLLYYCFTSANQLVCLFIGKIVFVH